MRGVFAFADDGDLIAVLAVPQIDVHTDGDKGDDEDIEQILDAEKLGEPAAGKQVGPDDIGAGLIRHLEEVFHKLNGNIVHHQGEQRFVGVPVCLEKRRNNTPDDAGKDCRDRHNENEQAIGDLASQHQHAHGGGQTANEHLALGAGIPEAHAECRCNRQRNAEQNGDIVQGDQHTAGAECTVENSSIDGKGVIAGEDKGDHAAHDECQQDCRRANENGAPQRNLIPAGNIDKRLVRRTSAGRRRGITLGHLPHPPFLFWSSKDRPPPW